MRQHRNGFHAEALSTPTPVPVVRWLFTREGRALTCQVDTDETGSQFEVAVVPHWDLGLTVVEEAPSTANALRRHAEIALMLKDAGWSVARHSA